MTLSLLEDRVFRRVKMNPFSMNLNLATAAHSPHRAAAADAACRHHKPCLAETLRFHLTSASLKIETPSVEDFATERHKALGLQGPAPRRKPSCYKRLVEAVPGLKR